MSSVSTTSMGILGKIGSFLGHAVKKVGEFGSNVISKVGNVAAPIYKSINHATGGILGNLIDNIPVAGPILKTIGKYAGNQEFMNRAANIVGSAGKIGGLIQRVSEGVGDAGD